ncbi:MAG: major capsid protein [Bacteroidota bacterium]
MPITLNQHRIGVTQTVVAKFSDDRKPKKGFTSIFPVQTTDAREVSIEVERNNQPMAVDVQRGTGGNRNTFTKSTEKIFVPPYYEENFDFTACERYDVTFAQGNAPTRMDAGMLVRSAMRKVEKLKNKIERAKELQRAQVLQTGIVVLKNGDSIDYKRQAGSMPVLTLGNRWNQAATAKPLDNFKTGMDFLRQEGLSGATVINAIMGSAAFNNFMATTQIKEQAEWRKINRIDLNMPQFDNVSGMAFQGQVAAGDFIINIWTYNEFYTDENGAKQTYLDTNTVVMVPDDFEGITQHAGVPAIMGDDATGKYIAPMEGEYYTRDVIDEIKMTWDFIIASAPLVIPVSVDRIYTIKTV